MGVKKKTAVNSNTLAQRHFKYIRTELGISQSKLAAAAGLPKATIANVEADRYFLSAEYGVAIYVALAQLATPQSPLYREAKEEAAKFLSLTKEEYRQSRIYIEGEIEQHKKRLEGLDRGVAWLEEKAAQLAEL